MKKYSYLNNPTFLMKAFQERSLHQYIKITVLSFNERPIKEIQGKVTSGTLNINGESAVRRTANLSVFIEEDEADYHNLQNLFSINKKVKIEIGIDNLSKDYSEYPILWFPFGVFALMELSLTHDINGTNASLQLKDKMVFLNGECGGTIGASIALHELNDFDSKTGQEILTKPTIIEIIRELVIHQGGEAQHRIIINDLEPRVKRVMKWIMNTPLYVYTKTENGNTTILYTDDLQKIKEDSGEEELILNEDYKEYLYGTDIGFTYGDFTYPGELIAKAGDSVCTVLDTIKNTLGNYEYFYDVYGNFIFQEIKNYLNTSKATVDLKYMNQDDYLINRDNGKAMYVFDNNLITTSFSNAPQYNMIKNDFLVWGMREGAANSVPIRYHLSIDNKPKIGNTYCCYFTEDSAGFSHAKIPIEYKSGKDFPVPGDIDRVYLDKSTNNLYVWDKISENDTGLYLYTTDEDCPVPWNEIKERKIILNQGAEDEKECIFTFFASNYCCLSAPNRVLEKKELYNEKQNLLLKYDNSQKNEKKLIEEKKKLEEEVEKIKKLGNDIPDNLKNRLEKIIIQISKIDKKLKTLEEQNLVEAIKKLKEELMELELIIIQMEATFSERVGQGATLITTKDWRTELYLSGIMTTRYGTNSNFYFTELVNEWPKLYDIQKGEFKEEVIEHPNEIDYFLDFIDSTSAISELNISNIGRRTKVINDDKINCIFETEIPDYIIIEANQEDTSNRITECRDQGQPYVQVSSRVFKGLALGGSLNSAYNMARDLLYQYTSYNEAITVQMLPLYFLEPNIRITVQDKESGIRGDYMIKSISIPFDVNGTMSLSCTRALEKI